MKKRSKGNQQSLRAKRVPSVNYDRASKEKYGVVRVAGYTSEGVVVEFGNIPNEAHPEKVYVEKMVELPFETAFLIGMGLHRAVGDHDEDECEKFLKKHGGCLVVLDPRKGEEGFERVPKLNIKFH